MIVLKLLFVVSVLACLVSGWNQECSLAVDITNYDDAYSSGMIVITSNLKATSGVSYEVGVLSSLKHTPAMRSESCRTSPGFIGAPDLLDWSTVSATNADNNIRTTHFLSLREEESCYVVVRAKRDGSIIYWNSEEIVNNENTIESFVSAHAISSSATKHRVKRDDLSNGNRVSCGCNSGSIASAREILDAKYGQPVYFEAQNDIYRRRLRNRFGDLVKDPNHPNKFEHKKRSSSNDNNENGLNLAQILGISLGVLAGLVLLVILVVIVVAIIGIIIGSGRPQMSGGRITGW